MAKKLKAEDIHGELTTAVDNAVNFMAEYEKEWELAERYYRGECDIKTEEGRSDVVKTEVRDAIRNTMPSMMRTLLQARKIVEYVPNSVQNAPWVEQQSEWVTQQFWRAGGYMTLYASIMDAAKLKIGPVKAIWKESPIPQFFAYKQVTDEFVLQLSDQTDVEIDELEEALDEEGRSYPIPLYNMSGYRYFRQGAVATESVPPHNFFISREANSIAHAIETGVHGHRRSVTVAEAIEYGLECDDWKRLDDADPETTEHAGSSAERRGYTKNLTGSARSEDILRHTFLLTEAYARYDFKDSGVPQLYRFWLGGTSNELLAHEEVEDSPFELVQLHPVPHSAVGNSLADLLIKEQDTSTSLLRAIIDNAHAANNPRLAYNPDKVNEDDIFAPNIGAPIRVRSDGVVQVIGIPSTLQGLLPILQYMDMDNQSKAGVTKAAQGLDPDAMQSTDKNAVINTIQTSQGQVEFMIRNVIETALIPLFRKIMRLSLAYMPHGQLIRTKGTFIPVNLSMFDPDLTAMPNVGLGTANLMVKKAALIGILQQQKEFMATMGADNPFTSYAQMYNTLEDIAEIDGIYDVSRYYKIVTPTVEQALAKRQAEAAKQAQAEGPSDPAKALVVIEQVKNQGRIQELLIKTSLAERELAQKSIVDQETVDLEHKKIDTNKALKLAELGLRAVEVEKTSVEEKAKDAKEAVAATDTKKEVAK